MARQQFEQGQVVYLRTYGNSFRKGIVAEPDISRKAFGMSIGGGRNVHYVKVAYVEQHGTADMERTWAVLNNRRQIIDEAAYQKIARAKNRTVLRRTILSHLDSETRFALYTEEARIITKALPAPSTDAGDIHELALYLRGMFDFRRERDRQTRIDVQEERDALNLAATEARAQLAAQGESDGVSA